MKEMHRLYVYIVYIPPHTPQDIVDKRMVVDRCLWKNCNLCKNLSAEKALKTRLFFDMIGKPEGYLSTSYPLFSTCCGKKVKYPQLIHKP